MGDIVNTKENDIDDDQGQLCRGVDCRNEGQEDVESEGKEKDPGHDLLRMKRQLEAMNTSPLSKLLDRSCRWLNLLGLTTSSHFVVFAQSEVCIKIQKESSETFSLLSIHQ